MLAAAPKVYIASSLDSCDAEAFGQALRAVRPDLTIGAGNPPEPDESVRVAIKPAGREIDLTVTGRNRAVARRLDGTVDCEAASQTAALIVDRAIDDFDVGRAPQAIETLAPPPRLGHLSISAGATARQGMLAPAGGLTLQLDVRLGVVMLGIAGGLFFPNARPIGEGLGTYSERQETLAFAGGLSPKLGPGRLTLGGGLGVAWTALSVQSDVLFQQQGGTAAEPYLGLNAAYALELPLELFLRLQIEEQVALGRTVFAVQGEQTPALETRAFSYQGALLLGRRLF
jgi:hypothetical protein